MLEPSVLLPSSDLKLLGPSIFVSGSGNNLNFWLFYLLLSDLLFRALVINHTFNDLLDIALIGVV